MKPTLTSCEPKSTIQREVGPDFTQKKIKKWFADFNSKFATKKKVGGGVLK